MQAFEEVLHFLWMSAVHTAVTTLAGVTEVKCLPVLGAEKAGLTGAGVRSKTSSSVGLLESPSTKSALTSGPPFLSLPKFLFLNHARLQHNDCLVYISYSQSMRPPQFLAYMGPRWATFRCSGFWKISIQERYFHPLSL